MRSYLDDPLYFTWPPSYMYTWYELISFIIHNKPVHTVYLRVHINSDFSRTRFQALNLASCAYYFIIATIFLFPTAVKYIKYRRIEELQLNAFSSLTSLHILNVFGHNYIADSKTIHKTCIFLLIYYEFVQFNWVFLLIFLHSVPNTDRISIF